MGARRLGGRWGVMAVSEKWEERPPRRHKTGLVLVGEVLRFNFGKLIGLNLLFLAACVPIITIPSAMAAMSRVLGLMLAHRPYFLFYDFRMAFVRNWKRASAAGWSILGLLIVSAVALWLYPRGGVPGGFVLAAVCLMVMAYFAAAAFFVFPMVVSTDLSVREILKNAFLLPLIRLPYTLLSLLGTAVVLIVCFGFLPFSALLFPLLGCSLIGLLQTESALAGIRKHVAGGDEQAKG